MSSPETSYGGQPSERVKSHEGHTHTANINGIAHDIYKMQPFAEHLPVAIVPIAQFAESTDAGNSFWTDSEGNSFLLGDILQDWEASKQNPLWTEHVKKIENADLSYPIWVINNNHVIDGMHRLVKAMLDKEVGIKVRFVDDILEQGLIE